MKKKILILLFSILMFSLVGCNKTAEDIISKEIDGKYVFENFQDNTWQSEKYAYEAEDILVCYINGDNTVAYLVKEDENEYLELENRKLDEDGKGVEYTFKSKANGNYKLHAFDNGDNLQIDWISPTNETIMAMFELFEKEECEDKIKKYFNEVELKDFISSNFKEDANLSLDKIDAEVEAARNSIYEQTKEKKEDVYYIYYPKGAFGSTLGGYRDDHYAFIGIRLDENGQMVTMDDAFLLVKKDDYSLYDYKIISENESSYLSHKTYENASGPVSRVAYIGSYTLKMYEYTGE